MSQQQYEMYHDYSAPSRSPVSNRAYGHQTLNRQPSRHFEQYNQLSNSIYAADDQSASRYDPSRFDRMAATTTLHPAYGYDSSTWSYNANGAATIGASSRLRSSSSRRQPLPSVSRSGMGGPREYTDASSQQWQEPPPPMPNALSNLYGIQAGPHSMQPHAQMRAETAHSDPDEELIPTAIVIKNIPFAVKKEALMNIMTEMNLPLPYAFNYHFDNGVFRGLAFANFTTAEETGRVIDQMNHMDLQGRKLRVEYKKMLPLAERERIEREKRERRGQLEEQHRPVQGGMLHNQPSMSSLTSAAPANSPSPISMRGTTVTGKPFLENSFRSFSLLSLWEGPLEIC
jgi:hypothetical protein